MRTDAIPKPTEKWTHFKGTVYTVVGLARDCEDQAIQVVYFHASEMWVRSLSSWMEFVRDKQVAGRASPYSGPRFVRLETSAKMSMEECVSASPVDLLGCAECGAPAGIPCEEHCQA